MSGVPRVRSNVEFPNTNESGKGGKTPLTPSSKKDTISEEPSNQGVIGYFVSLISDFFYTLFDGMGVVYSWIRRPFEWAGILTPTKSKDDSVELSIEEQMKQIEASFKEKSPSEKLRVLAYEVTLLEGTDVEAFFTKLFKQQDEKVLKALTEYFAPGFNDLDHDAVREGLPKQLYLAFSKKPEEQTSHEVKLIELYRSFMLGFPDYVLTYVDTCFSENAPSSYRFEALRILVEYEGPQEKYHRVGLNLDPLLEALKEALKKYYGKLTEEEKEKIFVLVDQRQFESAQKALKQAIINERSNDQMLQIFKDQKVKEGDLTDKTFGYTLDTLMRNTEKWPLICTAIFEQFPPVKSAFTQARDEIFLAADRKQQATWCKYAFEAEPNIFKINLAAIVAGGDEDLVKRANENILLYNEAHAIDLFRAYRDAVVVKGRQEGINGKQQVEAEFLRGWMRYISIGNGFDQILDLDGFINQMQAVAMTQEYRDAASSVIQVMDARSIPA